VATVFFVRAERHEIQIMLEIKGRTALNLVGPRISHVFDRNHLGLVTAELRPLLEDRDFDYAFIFDDTGVLLSRLCTDSRRGARCDPNVTQIPQTPPLKLTKLHKKRFVRRTTGKMMQLLTPIIVDGKRVAGLGLGISLNLPARQVSLVRSRLLGLAAFVMVSVLAFLYWWTGNTFAPLRQLTRGAQQISQGDSSVRVPPTRPDQVGQLAVAFNQLAESLQRTLKEKHHALVETNRLYRNLKVARARLGRAERLSAVGMLAAGVSHELNNPLGIILSTAGNLREALGPESACAEDVAIIESETERCRAIIQGLLNFAASGNRNPANVDINALLRETCNLAVRDERARGLNAQWLLDTHLPALWVDPRQMQQVFLNLLLNAADAMGGKGTVTVRTGESIEGGRRKILIEFIDQGCGIRPADLDHIFDPFYTTKKGGAGFGLGLAVSFGIITAHGGEITVASELGRGTTFAITLPVRAETRQVEVAAR